MSEKLARLNLDDAEWRKLARYAKRADTSLYPFLETIIREWLNARETRARSLIYAVNSGSLDFESKPEK